MRITYLVCCDLDRGIAECVDRGLVGIARCRYVTPDKDEFRIVNRTADFVPFPGKTFMVKGADYEDGPSAENEVALNNWIKEKAVFDQFVASGAGVWVGFGEGSREASSQPEARQSTI